MVAVEKNPCAVTVLRWRLANDAIWHGRVTLTAADMRTLGTTVQVDIVVRPYLKAAAFLCLQFIWNYHWVHDNQSKTSCLLSHRVGQSR